MLPHKDQARVDLEVCGGAAEIRQFLASGL
jgi:hypothetical protein